MAKYPRRSKGKKINPTFFIFCEGKSEDAYISFLKSKYRVPIEILSKKEGNRITQKYVNNTLKPLPRHQKDKLFLMYDLDAPGMLDKLRGIKAATLLVSNPCFELWYILHYCTQSSEIFSQQCIKKLTTLCKSYRKGAICVKLRDKLSEDLKKAGDRARKLTLYQNPSTSVYLLIEELDTTLA